MSNQKILTDFFKGDEEFIINEKILDDINYVVPKDRILDYIKKLLDIPYSEFIDFLQTWSLPKISSDSITQLSSFSAAEIEMCEVLIANNNLGLSYYEIGSLFPQYCTSNTQTALKKYGENQVKTAKQLGLTFQYYGKWYLNCFGYVYKMLSSSEQKSLIARTLLRDALYGSMMRDITKHDIYLEDYLNELSESTVKRRASGIIKIFEIAHGEAICNNMIIFKLFAKRQKSNNKYFTNKIINYIDEMKNDNLTELYALRDSLIKYNAPIPSEILEQISIEENLVYTESARELLNTFPHKIDNLNCRSCIIAAQYKNGNLEKTVVDFNSDLEDLFQNVELYVNKFIEDSNVKNIPDSNNSTDERKRSKSIGFSVRFADGHIVSESNGIKTMIETLRYIGLERVSKYRKVFSGYYLVDKQQREDNRHTWQHYVDGWWIYANLSNGKKIAVLKEIAKMFEISLEIFIDKQPNTSPDSLSTSINQKKRTKYSLNGGIACYKNQSVLNAIHLFMDEMPNATYADILEFFPKELQGSYGVIQTLSQIEERKAKGFQTENRFFLGNNEILTSGDGIRFAVSSEWGPINFPIFQKHILENFGWTLNEVE